MSRSEQSRNSQRDSKWGAFLFGILAGGAIGAALGLSYAPSEGAEFRKDVGEKFDEITDSINAILRNAKMSAEKMLNEGRGNAEEMLDTVEESTADLIDESEDAISNFRKSSDQNTNGHAAPESTDGSSNRSSKETGSDYTPGNSN